TDAEGRPTLKWTADGLWREKRGGIWVVHDLLGAIRFNGGLPYGVEAEDVVEAAAELLEPVPGARASWRAETDRLNAAHAKIAEDSEAVEAAAEPIAERIVAE